MKTFGVISKDIVSAYRNFYDNIKKVEKEGTVLFQKFLHDKWRWISAHSTTIFSKEGKPAEAVISYIDIIEKYEKKDV